VTGHPIETMLTEMLKQALREVLAESGKPSAPDQLQTLENAAEQLTCHRSYVGKLIRKGELPAIRRGRNYVRVAQSDLDELKKRWRSTRRGTYPKSA
jgi:excisionase family DNA binding protein